MASHSKVARKAKQCGEDGVKYIQSTEHKLILDTGHRQKKPKSGRIGFCPPQLIIIQPSIIDFSSFPPFPPHSCDSSCGFSCPSYSPCPPPPVPPLSSCSSFPSTYSCAKLQLVSLLSSLPHPPYPLQTRPNSIHTPPSSTFKGKDCLTVITTLAPFTGNSLSEKESTA